MAIRNSFRLNLMSFQSDPNFFSPSFSMFVKHTNWHNLMLAQGDALGFSCIFHSTAQESQFLQGVLVLFLENIFKTKILTLSALFEKSQCF